MDRRINCKDCGINLGVIRDALLRKDIVYLCKRCYNKKEYKLATYELEKSFMNIFKDTK